jgi:hypothetical protein
MTDIDVRDALDRATRHLHPDPGLLEQVRRGGQRRLVRRRTLLGAGLAAGVAGGTASVWVSGGGPPPTGIWLLDRPTAGDLAGDEGYLRQVRALWAQAYGSPENRSVLLGEPHVVWAGGTPAGPAAWIAQRHTGGNGEPAVVLGFVEPTAAGPRLVAETLYGGAALVDMSPPAILIGEQRDVLVVLDTGAPLRWSSELRYLPDGRIARSYQPVPFTDAVAVLRVPAQRSRISLGLLSGTTTVGIANAQDVLYPDTGSPGSETAFRDLTGPGGAWPQGPAGDLEADAWVAGALKPYLDEGGYQPQVPGPAWVIRATTPDGRRLSLRTPSAYDSRLRVLVFAGTARGVDRVGYHGYLRPAAPLPIMVRLPERQGVLVAGIEVKMRYRTARGEWLPVRGDAALLPHSAAEVEVTPPVGKAVTLMLP